MSAKALSVKSAIILLLLLLTCEVILCRAMTGGQLPPSSSEATHWRIFRSQKFGFEVKHPPDFNVSEDPAGYIVFAAPHADARFGLTISRLRQRGKLTLAEFVHDDTSYGADHSFSFADESVASRNGMTVYRFRRILGSSARQENFFLKNPSEGTMADYLIEYDRCNGGGCGEGENSGQSIVKDPHIREYDQILSTFRFTRPASTDVGQ